MKTKKILKLATLVILLIVMVPLVALTHSNKSSKNFVKNYIKPATNYKVNKHFTYPLPDIPGLEHAGDILVQSMLEDTVQTNIMTKYVRDYLNVIEVYKNTENTVSGTFIRLIGSSAFVEAGFPPFFIDCAVLNVNFSTGEPADISSMIAIHNPGADDTAQRQPFLDCVIAAAALEGITLSKRDTAARGLPVFWGDMLSAGSRPGLDLEAMHTVRDIAWTCYEEKILCSTCGDPNTTFDYRPIQEYFFFEQALHEHHLFENLGLSVPVGGQGAFFRAFVDMPLDSDEDGILDAFDNCPNTPPGVEVDENGCPLD